MLAARVLKPHGAGGSRFQRIVDRSFDRVSAAYGRRVASTLNYRPVTLMIVAALSARWSSSSSTPRASSRRRRTSASCSRIVNAPAYATSDYTEAFIEEGRRRDRGRAGGRHALLGRRLRRHQHRLRRLRPGAVERARPQPGGGAAGRAGAASTRSPACRPSSSRRRRCRAPAAACRCNTSSARPATPTRSSRSPRRSRTAPRRAAASSSCRTRSSFTQPQALRHHRPRPRRGARRRGQRDRHDADGAGRRRLGLEVRPRQPQLRRHHAGRRALDRFNPESLGAYYVRSASGAMVPLSAVITVETQRRAGRHRAVQPAELRDDLRPAAARRRDRRRARRRSAQIAREVMPAGFYRGFRRPVAAGDQRRQHDADRLRPRDHHHLPGARRAVRELSRSADHHADGAAVDLRRAGAAQSRPLDAQHLHAGRPDHADRPDHQARHPDGAVRQPAARAPACRSSTRSSRRRACGCGRS